MKFLASMASSVLSKWMSARGVSVASPGNALFDQPGRRFLHVGCGAARKADVAPGLQGDDWVEIRLDIDPAASPDIVANMLDMAAVPDASVEAIYSSHNIEHLWPYEVPLALAEFARVLKDDGFVLLTCPDLQTVAGVIADDCLDEVLYQSVAGPITALDMVFGHVASLAAGKFYMAHRTGFTLRTLVGALRSAGFKSVAGRRRPEFADLWVVAVKAVWSDAEMQRLADRYLPGQ